jgi:hypothetical protein
MTSILSAISIILMGFGALAIIAGLYILRAESRRGRAIGTSSSSEASAHSDYPSAP